MFNHPDTVFQMDASRRQAAVVANRYEPVNGSVSGKRRSGFRNRVGAYVAARSHHIDYDEGSCALRWIETIPSPLEQPS